MSTATKTVSESMFDLQVRVDKALKDKRKTDASPISVEIGDIQNAIAEVTKLRHVLKGAENLLQLATRQVGRENFVHQTLFGRESWKPDTGNCFPACLATLLGLKLEEVPHAYSVCANIDQANSTFSEFLGKRGYHLAYYPSEVVQNGIRDGWFYTGDENEAVAVIVTGKSPRFNGLHAVVGVLDPNAPGCWRLLHDPHPDGTGVTDVSGFEMLSRPIHTRL